MARFAWTYLTIGGVMLAMDIVWLSVMAPRFYRPRIGALMRESFEPVPAILFYLLFVAGLVTFVALPGWDDPNWVTTLGRGALFGLVAFATYDLTNQATLRGWPWLITAIDLVWGMSLCGISATLGVTLARAISGTV
jgi:uncharacterized membrane protein